MLMDDNCHHVERRELYWLLQTIKLMTSTATWRITQPHPRSRCAASWAAGGGPPSGGRLPERGGGGEGRVLICACKLVCVRACMCINLCVWMCACGCARMIVFAHVCACTVPGTESTHESFQAHTERIVNMQRGMCAT